MNDIEKGDVRDRGLETSAVHAGWTPEAATGAVNPPIYATSTYAQDGVGGLRGGYEYSRTGNPTRTALEKAIAELERGKYGRAFGSGMAASDAVLRAMLKPGDHIIIPNDAYGGTFRLIDKIFAKWGIDYTPVAINDLDEVQSALTDRTRLVWAESPTNPLLTIADIPALAKVAHSVNARLVVDNTFATPALQQPLSLGADIVVHSATKYLGGHGTSIAGAIVDSGAFDFSSQPERFPLYNTPDESYHGLVYARDLGVGGALGANLAFLLRIQTLVNRDLGAVTSPFNAFLISQGIETLSLRVERHVSNALAVARFLEEHPDVESVNYAGLESSPYSELGRKYAPLGVGGLLSVDI